MVANIYSVDKGAKSGNEEFTDVTFICMIGYCVYLLPIQLQELGKVGRAANTTADFLKHDDNVDQYKLEEEKEKLK